MCNPRNPKPIFMSNLLEQASLVMIPSGYKEDVVYSQIPLDGAGDLAFTRASNGTRINSQGLVEVVPWNLFTYSEDFANADWIKVGSTISSNVLVAPNGTTTADKLVEDTSNGVHIALQISGERNVNSIYAFSVYAKAGERTKINLFNNGNGLGNANFDLSNGTATLIAGEFATIESVGNGWYRCVVGMQENSTVGNFNYHIRLLDASGSDSYTGNGTSGAYIWGAQVNLGTAKPYFPTTDRLNVPRLTYQNGGGGCPSLLLEKQSTNLVTYSEQFDNVLWTQYQGGTITANSVTSPDGTQNADTLTVASGQTYSGIYQSVSASSDVYTLSVFAKYNTKRWLFFFDASASAQGWFDIQNGVLGTIPSGHTGTIENFGDGWFRCTFKKNTAVTPAFFQIGLVDSNGSLTPSSNGSSYIWGAQVEASSYPTSYIPSTSSSATRVADACLKTNISSLIGQTEGVLFVDFYYDLAKNTPSGSDKGIMTIRPNGGSYNNEIALLYYGDEGGSFGKTIQVTVTVGGTVQCNLKTPQTLTNGYYKVAFAYKQNDFALYVNGVQIGTDTSGSVPTCDELYLVDPLRINPNTTIKEAILFPTRLTNAELASLTTL